MPTCKTALMRSMFVDPMIHISSFQSVSMLCSSVKLGWSNLIPVKIHWNTLEMGPVIQPFLRLQMRSTFVDPMIHYKYKFSISHHVEPCNSVKYLLSAKTLWETLGRDTNHSTLVKITVMRSMFVAPMIHWYKFSISHHVEQYNIILWNLDEQI